MKKKIGTIGKKIVIFLKEAGNFVANLFVPIMSLIVATAALLQAPTKLLFVLKKIEYWFFKISGTMPIINEQLDNAEKLIDSYTKEKE